MPAFFEFFAGGGMVRQGLGANWTCRFANDIDPRKALSYAENWGDGELWVEDVAKIRVSDLPPRPDLAWASFPCQDLSLAGSYAGLEGSRSGTFWPFWRLVKDLQADGRQPSLVVLENVCGALTSHGGRDFAAIGEAMAAVGYRFGAVVIDAVHFVPQSRPRLFIVAVREDWDVPSLLVSAGPVEPWHPRNLVRASAGLSAAPSSRWIWWALAPLPCQSLALADIVEYHDGAIGWHSPEETDRLIRLMNSHNATKVRNARLTGVPLVGTIYRRTRVEDGVRNQRAEVRFDGVAGCLRTPGGGSSRQTLLFVEGERVESRLLSAREAARLMGLPDSYKLPNNYNDAYRLCGDGVVVPVVRFLAASLLEPLIDANEQKRRRAA